MINNDFNLSFGIKGFAEVKDKNGNIIQKDNNSILPWGKYKLISSLFQTKNEWVDGIKYIELSSETMNDKTLLESYLNLNIKKRFQINRRENLSLLQYNKITYEWEDFGQFLKEYLWKENDYRKSYLLEQYDSSPTDFLTFLNIFNLDDITKYTDRIMVDINIPLIRDRNEPQYEFNTMLLTYGGEDIENDSQGRLQIHPETNEIKDPNIQNTNSELKNSWTSGLPFSMIEFNNNILVEDYVSISWKYLFDFNFKG